MEKSALAQEKVWFDKPSYDKAERLYFERMAKVVSRKIMDTCSLKSETCVTGNCQDVIINKPLSKRKSEKSKEHKSLISENVANDILKSSKCQMKALKTERNEDDYNVLKKRNSEDKLKYDSTKNDSKEKELNSLNDALEKSHLKEPKEKKSRAETRHRNRGKGKHIENQELKDRDTPIIRNKDQLPNQGKQHTTSPILPSGGCLANEVAKVRQRIKQSLQCVDDIAAIAGVPNQAEDGKKDNLDIGSVVEGVMKLVQQLERRVEVLEENIKSMQVEPYLAICPAKPATPPNETTEKKEDDDDVDLFGSDSEGEDAEAAKIREERLAAYAAKKSKKPALIAKSNIILDVKPWDDETDMKAMEAAVRQIECNGLLWGAAQLVPLAYGIHKLQISCVVEDEKVSVDCLTEQILEIADYVQSVDIAAFNKV